MAERTPAEETAVAEENAGRQDSHREMDKGSETFIVAFVTEQNGAWPCWLSISQVGGGRQIFGCKTFSIFSIMSTRKHTPDIQGWACGRARNSFNVCWPLLGGGGGGEDGGGVWLGLVCRGGVARSVLVHLTGSI